MRGMKLAVFVLVLGAAAYAVVRGLARDGEPVCGPEMASLVDVDRAAEKAAFIVVLLPGEAGEENEAAEKRLREASAALSTEEKPVMVFVLKRESDDFSRLVGDFKLKNLPAAIIAGRSCGAQAVSGELSERSLRSTLAELSRRKRVCCPGSGK